MSKRTILFLVPYKARDFNGNALVAYLLEKKYGFKVVLTNSYHIEYKIRTIKPDMLIIDHAFWKFKAEQIRLAKSLGVKAVLLPTEGLIFKDEVILGNAGVEQNVNHLLDINFVWGNHHAKVMQRAGITNENLAVVTGCARFDYYRPPMNGLLQTREEFAKKWKVANTNGPNILWATNTPYFARDHEDVIKRYAKTSTASVDRIKDLLHDQTEQFKQHSKLVTDLAQRHPDWNFFIKVHPAEWTKPYEDMEKQYPNIYLGYNAQIHDFLANCDVLIQRNCTTATEAWMLDVPVLQPEIGSYKEPSTNFYLEGNDVVHSLEETETAIQQYLGGKPIPEDQKKVRDQFVSDFYFSADGRASERIAEKIAQVLNPPAYSDIEHEQTVKNITESYNKWKAGEDKKLANKVKDLFGIDRRQTLRLWKKFKKNKTGKVEGEVEITPEMVKGAYAELDKVLSVREEIGAAR